MADRARFDQIQFDTGGSPVPLSATIAGVAALTAPLALDKPLRTTIVAISGTVGNLSATVTLHAQADAVSSITSNLQVEITRRAIVTWLEFEAIAVSPVPLSALIAPESSVIPNLLIQKNTGRGHVTIVVKGRVISSPTRSEPEPVLPAGLSGQTIVIK